MEERTVGDLFRYEVSAGIARITLDRTEAGNSLTPGMRDHLCDGFDEASADVAVRAVVLTGAGDHHSCTGAGLGGPQPPGPARPGGAPQQAVGDVARLVWRGWQRLIASILDCEKPVIAAVNGMAAGGCYLLPRIIGPQRAKQLMFFGDRLSADDCERFGIANAVVPAAELQATCERHDGGRRTRGLAVAATPRGRFSFAVATLLPTADAAPSRRNSSQR